MTLYGVRGGRLIMKRTLTSIPDVINIYSLCDVCISLKQKYKNDSRYRTTYEDEEYRVMYPLRKWPLELIRLLDNVKNERND